MFQQELERLQMRLAEAQTQYSGLERQYQALAQQLSDQKQLLRESEADGEALEAETNDLRRENAELRRQKERLDRAEGDLVQANQRVKTVLETVDKLSEDLGTYQKRCEKLQNDLAERTGELITARAQLDPVEKLMDALKEQHRIETVIKRELSRVGS